MDISCNSSSPTNNAPLKETVAEKAKEIHKKLKAALAAESKCASSKPNRAQPNKELGEAEKKLQKESLGPTTAEARRNPAIDRAWKLASDVMNVFYYADERNVLESEETQKAFRNICLTYGMNEKIISSMKKTKVKGVATEVKAPTIPMKKMIPVATPVYDWVPLGSRTSSIEIGGNRRVLANTAELQRKFIQEAEQAALLKRLPALSHIEKSKAKHMQALSTPETLNIHVNPILDSIKTPEGVGSTYGEILKNTAEAVNARLTERGYEMDNFKINNTDIKQFIYLEQTKNLLKPQLIPKTLSFLREATEDKWLVKSDPEVATAFKEIAIKSGFDTADAVDELMNAFEKKKTVRKARYLGPNHPKVVLLQALCETSLDLVNQKFRDPSEVLPLDVRRDGKFEDTLKESMKSLSVVYQLG